MFVTFRFLRAVPILSTGAYEGSAIDARNTRLLISRVSRVLVPVVAVAIIAAACGEVAEHAVSPGPSITVAYCCGRDALGPVADASARYLVFLPLTELDTKGERHPRLALRWEHSADGRESTYHLRTDVRWHDGVPVTAHDVKFTLDLLHHPDVGYWPPGAHESTVPNDSTITIRSANGFGEDDWWQVFYPKHIVERLDPKAFYHWGFWTHPVGNGPYRLVRYVPETMMEFGADTSYPITRPRIRRVVLRFVQDAALAELLAGGVDAIFESDPGQIAQLSRDPRFTIHHSSAPTVARALYWKSDHRLFRDVRVRQALTAATDRRLLLSALNLPDTIPITDGPYTSRQFLRHDLPPPLPYDTVKARALLDSAGWRDTDGDGIRDRDGLPFRFTALVRQDPSFDVISVLVQDQLRHVGVKMELETVESELISARVRKGQFEAAFILSQHLPGWLRRHFGGETPVGYRNSEVVRLTERALATANSDVMDAIYRELMTIFTSDVPVTFLFPRTESYFVHRRVRGLEGRYWPDPVQHMEHLWLEER
ncbi:MAG: ABC transporter substrate-binding protein [Gemmatimonadaceae bacterium]